MLKILKASQLHTSGPDGGGDPYIPVRVTIHQFLYPLLKYIRVA